MTAGIAGAHHTPDGAILQAQTLQRWAQRYPWTVLLLMLGAGLLGGAALRGVMAQLQTPAVWIDVGLHAGVWREAATAHAMAQPGRLTGVGICRVHLFRPVADTADIPAPWCAAIVAQAGLIPSQRVAALPVAVDWHGHARPGHRPALARDGPRIG